MIKFDLLSIEALDKIRACLDLLLKDKRIEWQGSLRATYEKYLGIYTLERADQSMWEMLWNHKVLSFFQMEKESGIQAIALSKPTSVDDLAALNSVMRLMPQEKGEETPLNKFARFKNDIQEWYNEMDSYDLTKEEQETLNEIIGMSYGICQAQEYLMLLVMNPQIGGFSLNWADQLRKSVAKKKPKDFMKLEKEFFKNAEEKHLSKNLVNYVWNVLIRTQRGYGFNSSHTLAYSLIGLQELNLAYKYPILYWDTANLIVNSGSLDIGTKKSTDYGKIATAIANIRSNNIKIELPLINEAEFGFKPDIENNRIIYSFKSLCGIGDDVVDSIINNRPFTSFDDFCNRMINTKKISVLKTAIFIKAGSFVELDNQDRTITMKKLVNRYAAESDKLTFQQFSKLEELHLFSPDIENLVKMKRFKEYVLDNFFLKKNVVDPSKKIPKCGYHDREFVLDNNSMVYFKDNFSEDSVIGIVDEYYVISEKRFLKEWNKKIQPLRDYLNSTDLLKKYNDEIKSQDYTRIASGSVPHWEMESLSFYYTDHELSNLQNKLYGVVNYFEQPLEPEIYDTYLKYINNQPKIFPKYKINRIAGTVLNTDKNRHTITLLTINGVVNVKFGRGQFAFYNKQISERMEEDSDKKTVLESSWFKRGTLLLIAGYRHDNQWMAYKYADSIYKHLCARITEVHEDGTVLLQMERTQV